MIYQPAPAIRRLGVAIEFADGRKVMIYSEDPTAEVTLSSETEGAYDMFGRPYIVSRETTIEVSRLHYYTIYEEGPREDDPDVDKALTLVKELTGGRT